MATEVHDGGVLVRPAQVKGVQKDYQYSVHSQVKTDKEVESY